jgi:hypothetical protein
MHTGRFFGGIKKSPHAASVHKSFFQKTPETGLRFLRAVDNGSVGICDAYAAPRASEAANFGDQNDYS